MFASHANRPSRRSSCFDGSRFGVVGDCQRHLGRATTKPRKVIVGAHPWVYAAKLPNYDITPKLPQIFADMSYAGFDGIELIHSALRPDDAVERIGELSHKHRLAIIGMSFGGAMWDRKQRQAILEDAELTITRLAKLGGRTLGTSVGPATKKTPQQLDAQAELLRKIIALGKANGVVLNLHNHTYEVADNLYDLRGTLAADPRREAGARSELAGPRAASTRRPSSAALASKSFSCIFAIRRPTAGGRRRWGKASPTTWPLPRRSGRFISTVTPWSSWPMKATSSPRGRCGKA